MINEKVIKLFQNGCKSPICGIIKCRERDLCNFSGPALRSDNFIAICNNQEKLVPTSEFHHYIALLLPKRMPVSQLELQNNTRKLTGGYAANNVNMSRASLSFQSPDFSNTAYRY